MAKTKYPEIGDTFVTAQSAQIVTAHEVVPVITKSGAAMYRLRVTPAGVADHADRSRWTTASALIDFGAGWEAI